MKRIFLLLVTVLVFAFVSGTVVINTPTPVGYQAIGGEMAEHPRIAAAIDKIEDAIDYLKAAPHTFGGHKAAAIASCQKAVVQLRLALKYNAKQDMKHK